MPVNYIEITKDDQLKIKAVKALLENHATYGNMNRAQVGAFNAVIDYAISLAAKFNAAKPVEAPEFSLKDMKAKLKKAGYIVSKEEA